MVNILSNIKRKWLRDYSKLNVAHELGLMDVSTELMRTGTVRILNIAGADEAFGAKTVADIPEFLKRTKAMIEENRRVGSWAAHDI